MTTSRSVLILSNAPRGGAWSESDAGVRQQVEAVTAALRARGLPFRRAEVRALQDVPDAIFGGDEKVVFNLVESLPGDAAACCHVPAICQSLNVACTGNDGACLALCLDKWQAKAALAAHGVSTPAAAVVPVGAEPPAAMLPAGRVIVKPAATDASEGIEPGGVVEAGGAALAREVSRIHREVGQPALVETYVDGREINVAILQRGDKLHVLPPAEIVFDGYPDGKPRIVDYAAKWRTDSFEYRHTRRVAPAPLEPAAAERLRAVALAAWRATGCRDYARVDFRLDAGGTPFVIEVNPNPDIAPDAGFAAALAADGIAYADFALAVIDNARHRLAPAAAAPSLPAAGAESARSDTQVRWTEAEDRDAILQAVVATRKFRPGEIDIAREVLDEAIADGPTGHYQSYTALRDGAVAGWVCFGPVPCTVGTYDIYWIAVAPRFQRFRVGSTLMALAERLIVRAGGRMAVLETSSRVDYDATRKFYLARGYHLAAVVPDLYAPGDGKETYAKTFAEAKG